MKSIRSITRSAIAFAIDAGLGLARSTNKGIVLAAALGLCWALDWQVAAANNRHAAVIFLGIAFAADLCAAAWWRYGYRPVRLRDLSRTDVIELLRNLGVDPAEIEMVFGVELAATAATSVEDAEGVNAVDIAAFAHSLGGRCDCAAGSWSGDCPLVEQAERDEALAGQADTAGGAQ